LIIRVLVIFRGLRHFGSRARPKNGDWKIAEHLDDADADQVTHGIESDGGPWVIALIADYRLFVINPLLVALPSAADLWGQERCRGRAHPPRHGSHGLSPIASGRGRQ
jgi:hypothetical protein